MKRKVCIRMFYFRGYCMVIYELEIVKFSVRKIVIKFVYGVLGVVFYFYNYDVEGVVGGFDNGFYSLLFFVDLIVCYDD